MIKTTTLGALVEGDVVTTFDDDYPFKWGYVRGTCNLRGIYTASVVRPFVYGRGCISAGKCSAEEFEIVGFHDKPVTIMIDR